MGRLKRDPQWERILDEEIVKSKSKEFEYGRNDCTIWASNVVKSYTDLTWTAPWNNKKQALREHAKLPMEAQVTKVLGAPYGNIYMTRRGDLVQKDLGMDSRLGICLGSKVAFLKEGEGICYADLSDCVYSWRI